MDKVGVADTTRVWVCVGVVVLVGFSVGVIVWVVSVGVAGVPDVAGVMLVVGVARVSVVSAVGRGVLVGIIITVGILVLSIKYVWKLYWKISRTTSE